jgi:hypothetical protein
MKNTSVEKAYIEGLKKEAGNSELKKFKSFDDVPWESVQGITWNEELDIPVYVRGTIIPVPYTDAAREELRKVAGEYLSSVPHENRLGAKAMPVAREPGEL